MALFPFGDTPGAKVRPVLLLSDLVGPVPEVLAAYISTVMPSTLLTSDIVLDPANKDHTSTELKGVSVLRLHKLATIHARVVYRLLGTASPQLLAEAEARLRTLLKL